MSVRSRLALGSALILLMAGACTAGSQEEPSPTTEAPTSTTAVPTTTTTSTAPEAMDRSCVDCHTDEDTLRALAMEPVETEVLSEGEG